MKKTIQAVAAAAFLWGFAADAAAQVYGDVAKVIAARPVTERIPSPQCRVIPPHRYEPTSSPEFGGGYRRAANETMIEDAPAGSSPPASRCEKDPGAKERIVAYDVRYEYNGREFSARMPYDPGKEMPVNVEVRPPMARSSLAPRQPNYRGTY
jgi:hypothetical protein